MMPKILKIAAIFLALHMLMLSGLAQAVWAAMIRTESIIYVDRDRNPRDNLNNLLGREQVQMILISNGIDPQEARNRIDHLSDREINKFLDEIDRLPAGGSHLSVIIMSSIFLFLMVIDLFFSEPTPNN